ncbi:MAG: hypothetical protein ABDI07_09995 [Candidatus Kryptonium sp.]
MNSGTIKGLILEANYSAQRIRRAMTPTEFAELLTEDHKFNRYVDSFIKNLSMSPTVASELF